MNVFKKILILIMVALPFTLQAFTFDIDFRTDPGWKAVPPTDIGSTSDVNSTDYPVTVTVTSVRGGNLYRDGTDGFGIVTGGQVDEIDSQVNNLELLNVHFSAPLLITKILFTDLFAFVDTTLPVETAWYTIDLASRNGVSGSLHPNGEVLHSVNLITQDIWFGARLGTINGGTDPANGGIGSSFSVGKLEVIIPEPSTYLLLGSSLIIAMALRRKKQTA